jgi:hypothetical protein
MGANTQCESMDQMETRALYGTNVTVNAKCVVYVCSVCTYVCTLTISAMYA